MELKIKTRIILGKKVKHLRRDGLIPAELFGHGIENKHLSVPEKIFKEIYKKAGGHTIVQLITEEGAKIPVLISEVQHHPLSQQPLSILLHQVRMDEEIETKIPLEFRGESLLEKSGFVVVRVQSEIEIKALPDKIPHSFEIDLSTLQEPGESIHVKDIIFSEGKILTPGETVIATVTEKREEEVTPAGEAEAALPTETPKEAPTTGAPAKEEPK